MTAADHPPATGLPQAGDAVLVCAFTVEDLYSLRAAVSAHATQHAMDSGHLGKLLVVVTELAANAICHGGGHGLLRLWQATGAVHCTVSDNGPGISNPAEAGTHLVAASARGGRGLWLARQFSDQLTITSDHTGTTVTVRVNLKAA